MVEIQKVREVWSKNTNKIIFKVIFINFRICQWNNELTFFIHIKKAIYSIYRDFALAFSNRQECDIRDISTRVFDRD